MKLKKLRTSETGANLAEYSIVLLSVAVVALSSVRSFGLQTQCTFQVTTTSVRSIFGVSTPQVSCAATASAAPETPRPVTPLTPNQPR